MAGVALLLEEQGVIFVASQMLFKQRCHGVDKGIDLLTGYPLRQYIGKFRASEELQIAGKRCFIQLSVEAETNLIRCYGFHNKAGTLLLIEVIVKSPVNFAGSGAVKFAEKNALPGA